MVLTGAWEAQMMTEEQMKQLDGLQRIFSSSVIIAFILALDPGTGIYVFGEALLRFWLHWLLRRGCAKWNF